MVKRILIVLCLFMPFVSHVEAKSAANSQEVIVLGKDLDEKNIPLDLGIMEKAFTKAFHEVGAAIASLKDSFYSSIYTDYTIPFSERELFNACFNSTHMSAECMNFLKRYMELIVRKRKYLPSYSLQ